MLAGDVAMVFYFFVTVFSLVMVATGVPLFSTPLDMPSLSTASSLRYSFVGCEQQYLCALISMCLSMHGRVVGCKEWTYLLWLPTCIYIYAHGALGVSDALQAAGLLCQRH